MPLSQKEYEKIVKKYGNQYLAGKQVSLCFNCIHWTHPSEVTGCKLGRMPVSLTEDYCSDREA